MTIATTANLKLMLGLSSSITVEETSLLAILHPRAEAAVKRFLQYDPEQASRTEYYPRHDAAGGLDVSGSWDVNAARTKAIWERFSSASDTLQLLRLPVRRITSLYVDTSGRFGTVAGSFAAGTLYTEGTDFWAAYEEQYVCRSGLLHSYGSWPLEPGSVKVTYVAGYSTLEFADSTPSTSTTSDANGQVSSAGVDASGIARAVELIVVQAFNQWAMTKKHTGPGFVGMLSGESAGDYSYSVNGAYAASLIGTDLPTAAIQLLEPFVNFGILRA